MQKLLEVLDDLQGSSENKTRSEPKEVGITSWEVMLRKRI